MKAFDRSASPETKRQRLNILVMVKNEVEDVMLSSDDESTKEEAACSDDPDIPNGTACSDDPGTEWYTDKLPKE